jgi:hypothetical protein
MPNQNFYTVVDNNLNTDHVYDTIHNIEMNTLNDDQYGNSRLQTNAFYVGTPILGQGHDIDNIPRGNNNKKYEI